MNSNSRIGRISTLHYPGKDVNGYYEYGYTKYIVEELNLDGSYTELDNFYYIDEALLYCEEENINLIDY